MRRSTAIFLICLLAAGTLLAALPAGPLIDVPGYLRVHLSGIGGVLLLALAAIAGVVARVGGGMECQRLSSQLSSMGEAGALKSVQSNSPSLRQLVAGINHLIASANSASNAADLRVRELELQLKVVTAEREHLEAIIYSISDAVLVTDTFDELLLANDSAARLFNFDLQHSERAPIQRVLADSHMIELIRDMRQSDSRNGRRIVEFKAPSPAGERVFKVTLSSIAGPGDHPAGVVAVLHDMTREREVAQMKNDFVSSVSHELRTPLASIKAYAEMLIDGEASDDKTAHEFYEVIHNEANRLGRLIDNILNISRIESGLIKINKQPQSLTMILKEAIEVIAPQARQKQITINEKISPAYYQTQIDHDMIYESILNLLSNAVKYTPEQGQIGVDNLVDESRKLVTVRISDTGVGIPPKDLPFIFDKFYRSESNSRMAKGTGLGLSLVKHIIETVHHGRMFVESHVGKGSTFGFELPLVE